MSKLLETAKCSACDRVALITFQFDEDNMDRLTVKLCNACHEELIFEYADADTLELLNWQLSLV